MQSPRSRACAGSFAAAAALGSATACGARVEGTSGPDAAFGPVERDAGTLLDGPAPAPSDGAPGQAGAAPCPVPVFLADEPRPTGWAAMNGGTTGGGAAAPVLVTTLAALNATAADTTAAVIYVQGALAKGTVTIGSNKTVIGCSGTASLNGHVELMGSTNVIVRNLAIVGYNCAPPDVDVTLGGKCQDGADAITIERAAHNLWFDHVAISDGSDGNLDITHGSDFITISHTKFFYSTRRTDPNDTGAAGHRYSNLVGHDDLNQAEDTGHFKITFHHDWWADNTVALQPRIRFGQVHLYDNLWTSAGNRDCIGVGAGASVLTESNVFVQVSTPIDTTSYVNASIAPSSARAVGNLYTATTGSAPADLAPGSVFVPPYAYSTEPASAVEASVRASAGPR